MTNKTALRTELLKMRMAIANDVRRQWDGEIGRRLLAWCKLHPAQVIGIYWPIQNEPDLRVAYADLASAGVRLALPVVMTKGAPLEFAEWSPGDQLIKDSHGVPAPSGAKHRMRPDIVLAPCVGFNAERMRLGYGAGFYDRTLASMNKVVAIGIAYACGASDFTADAHDVPMDVLITEEFTREAGD